MDNHIVLGYVDYHMLKKALSIRAMQLLVKVDNFNFVLSIFGNFLPNNIKNVCLACIEANVWLALSVPI